MIQKLTREQSEIVVRKLISETSTGKRTWRWMPRGQVSEDFVVYVPNSDPDPYNATIYSLSYKDLTVISDAPKESDGIVATLFKVIKLQEQSAIENAKILKVNELIEWSKSDEQKTN